MRLRGDLGLRPGVSAAQDPAGREVVRDTSHVRIHGHDNGEDMRDHCRRADIVPRAARQRWGADEDRC